MKVDEINIEETLCFTGHRPNATGMFGYDTKDPRNKKLLAELRAKIVEAIEKYGITCFITGMALGVDTWAARIVLSLKKQYPHIKLIAALPCKAQWKRWKADDRYIWRQIIDRCDLVHLVSDTEYTPWCMQVRNVWMVDHSCRTIAVYTGAESGGTFNCVDYLKGKNKPLVVVNPHDIQVDAEDV